MQNLQLEDIPVVNMGRYVLDRMKTFGDTVAMVDGESEKTMTYRQLVERTERAAAGLQQFGISADDVICVISPNHMDYIVAFYASALICATFQPINPLQTTDYMRKVLKQCNSKYIMTVPSLMDKVKEASTEGTNVIKVIVFGESDEYTTFESLLDPAFGSYTTPDCNPKKSIVALMSSSGTTGFPKPVRMSHYSIVANTIQQRCAALNSSDDCFIVFLPFFHAYGLYLVTYYAHHIGAKVVIMSRFRPDEYLNLIQKHKPNILQLVPPVMVMFSKYPKVSEYDLSSVKTIICGAAPLSKELEAVVKAKMNLQCIHQGYGMTEVGVTHLNGPGSFKYKSVGKLLPLVEIKIVDVDTGNVLGPNEEGEIWIRGPQICSGYLNLPEETANLFTEDGWVKTGDIGCEDEEGYLFVVDRLKELIKYKAFQVAPATLEDILLTHDSIADAGVVGMPDENAGELPRAYVVLKPGQTVTEENIIAYVDGLVAPHMKLRGGVKFVTEIPRTQSGKILRKTLREEARQAASV